MVSLATAAFPQGQSASRPNRPVSLRSLPVSGILSDGGSFTGTLTISRFGYDEATGLVVDGTVTGSARNAAGTTTPVNQSFTNVRASLSEIGLPPLPTLGPVSGGGGGAVAIPTPRPTPTAASADAAPAGQQVQAQQVGAQAVCDILHLDIGPISLDLLGLQLDLSQIVLDLTAVSGAGNLLGNLLCAVAGLLDPLGSLTDLTSFLTALTGLLEQINTLL